MFGMKEVLIEKLSYMSLTHKINIGLLLIAMLMTLASVVIAEINMLNHTDTVLSTLFILISFGMFLVYKDSQKV